MPLTPKSMLHIGDLGPLTTLAPCPTTPTHTHAPQQHAIAVDVRLLVDGVTLDDLWRDIEGLQPSEVGGHRTGHPLSAHLSS